jgi:mannose-6-phosphate isomerase-like protein (cupin superfamily)
MNPHRSTSSFPRSAAGASEQLVSCVDKLPVQHGMRQTRMWVTRAPYDYPGLIGLPLQPEHALSWHVHPGAQELVFGLEGKLTLEIEGRGAKSIGVGETGLVPSDVPHTVRNETASEPAKILVVYSRSDKDQPVRVDLKKV